MTTMYAAFWDAAAFDAPIGGWDVSRGTCGAARPSSSSARASRPPPARRSPGRPRRRAPTRPSRRLCTSSDRGNHSRARRAVQR